MIMDRLERFRCYQRSVPELWDAVRFAERVQKEQLPPGKYPVGKGVAFVQEGNTRSFEEADFEVHRNYLDVHRSFWTDLKCGNMQTGQIWR